MLRHSEFGPQGEKAQGFVSTGVSGAGGGATIF